MATVASARAALAAYLAGVAGLRVARYYPESVNAPMVALRRTAGPTRDSGGVYTVTFQLTLFVQWNSGDRVQEALDGYVEMEGAASLRAKIEADPTLGGAVDAARLGEWGPDTSVAVGSADYGSAVAPVQVWYRPG